MTKIAGAPAHDATLPTVEITLEGQTYHLAFTWAALSAAKKELVRHKLHYNVLVGCDIRALDVDTLPIMFWAACFAQHPELTLAEATELINMRTYLGIADAVAQAYIASMEAPKKDAPKNDEAE